jgi:hypothetical protein
MPSSAVCEMFRWHQSMGLGTARFPKWCAFDRAIEEIETVNIEDGFQAGTSFSTGPVKNARAVSEETAPRSAVETNRRDVPST